jgi:hypothetical protein
MVWHVSDKLLEKDAVYRAHSLSFLPLQLTTSPLLQSSVAVAVAAVSCCYLYYKRRRTEPSSARIIVAVSGTIQDGFELRKNIDYRAPCGATVEAVLIGYGIVRGVKMYFDIKDRECREYDPTTPHRVNPAMVLTGDPRDANQYALYLVDERACLNALLGEPRFLTMTPDTVRLDLNDPQTSPEVTALARTIIAHDGKANTDTCAVLAVVPCFHSKHFVPAPSVEIREDGTRLTSFRASLAAFAGLKTGASTPEPGTSAWNEAVENAISVAREHTASEAPDTSLHVANEGDTLYGTTSQMARISRRLSTAEFNDLAREAGLTLRAE